MTKLACDIIRDLLPSYADGLTSQASNCLLYTSSYKDLKPSYVIFICMKDPFEKGEAIYQFQMIDKNLQLQLNDETYTIILAIDCPKGKIPKELETFFTLSLIHIFSGLSVL